MNRRHFLKSVPFSAVVPSLLTDSAFKNLFSAEDPDTEICLNKFKLAVSLELQSKPIGDVIVEIGKSFLGTEYLAHTLEEPGEEHLVINLRGFDCVSFYENCLVLARCIKKNEMTFEAFKKELQFIRYRGGVINGYPSRLHYTSDYFYDNVRKGVVRDVTREIGGVPYEKAVNFMSTHVDSYIKLKGKPDVVKLVAEQEEEITKRPKFYLPKDRVAEAAAKIHNGDILGITTNIEGMDITHTGLAVWQNGELHFMHAPITGAKVQITDLTLADYLAKIGKDTGIMVVRPLEPRS